MLHRCYYCSQHFVQRQTDWLVFCCSCWGKAAGTLGFIVAGPATATCCVWGCCCPSVLPGVVRLKENALPVVFLGVLCSFFFCSSSFACLQPWYLVGWCFSSSANRQLQHVEADVVLPFSWHSLYWWSPPHHKQRGGCLQFAQTWPNCWKLWHFVRRFWTLCLYLDCNVTQACKSENLLRFCRPRQSY
jgi:hypothetical protein